MTAQIIHLHARPGNHNPAAFARMERPLRRIYWHEHGRVLSAGEPPAILDAEHVRLRLRLIDTVLEGALEQEDDTLFDDLSEQRFQLLDALRDARRWRKTVGV